MKEEELVIKRITTNLLKTNVDNVDREAKNRRLTRQQMLDLILEERYKNMFSNNITVKKKHLIVSDVFNDNKEVEY